VTSLVLKYIVVASILTLSAAAVAADAQPGYPTKPVRFVVPFAPGGSSDIQARIISQKLTERWGVNVIVDNRPSAGGIAASDIVAHASADGHTLLLGHVGTHAFNPHLYKSLPYDTDRAFAPVTMTLTQPLVLVTAAGSPLQTVQMLVDSAKAAPGRLNYASAGIGSPNHLAAELFRSMSGASMAHVPYKGAVPAEIDTVAGRVDVFFDSMLSAIPLVRSKQLRALAVTSAQRSTTLPGTPTISEAGVRGYEMQTWNGVFVPAGTPPRVIAALNAAIVEILRMPDVKARLEGDGARLIGDTSAEFDRYVRAERVKWGEVIRRGNIQAQ
jgi:tripartite-type tricarboxylate transporter receptor subunit TctC